MNPEVYNLKLYMKVFIIAAITANGSIGLDANHRSIDWRSKADAKFFIERTKEAGVMIMGSTTYHTFKVRRTPPGRRLIVMSSRPDSIEGDGIEVTNESAKELVMRLRKENIKEVAICGGATIYQLFLEQNLVDEIYLSIEPVVFGNGVPFLRGTVYTRLSLIENRNLSEDTVLLHYRVQRDEIST